MNFGVVVEISDLNSYEKQGSLLKRAGTGSCAWQPPSSETAAATDPPLQPTPLAPGTGDTALPTFPLGGTVSMATPGAIAATPVLGNGMDEARRCLDECRSSFRKCTVDAEPSVESRKRNVDVIDCQAAGNCFCTETPWRTGSTSQIDIDKADKTCSNTCAAVNKGTQSRQNGGSKYSFDDLWACLAQAQGDQQPGTGQPVGCMGA
ncbi:MAG: hypothetical protein Q9213_002535 [Squamulea squamosa]